MRVLVAGIGNVFFGDDGFGVAVASRLAAERSLPEGTRVVDFGIRGLHLAFELFEPFDLVVLVDAAPRGGAPGTLYVIDPIAEPDRIAQGGPDAHDMDPRAVLALVERMNGALPRIRIVGCEPAVLEEGADLSDEVRSAIEPAVSTIRRIIETPMGNEVTDVLDA